MQKAREVMNVKGLESAGLVLPEPLKKTVFDLPSEEKMNIEEIRLRAMRPATICLSGGYERKLFYLGQPCVVSPNDLQELMENATKSSIHSYSHSIASGFLTLEGGHRMGICGTCVQKGGQIVSVGDYSSVNIRIAKEYKGISDGILQQLLSGGEFENTLVISPPGLGKTTLIRDLIRNLSTPGPAAGQGYRISVADERCEIFPHKDGVPQFDPGDKTDVISGAAKAEAIMLLLRAMSPQIIAIDEITCTEDSEAILAAQNCGVRFIATAHADHVGDLCSREAYMKLMSNHYFKHIVSISVHKGKRMYRLQNFGGMEHV